MPRGRAGWFSLLLSAFVLVAVVGAAACDDDDDDEEAAVAAAPTEAATPAATPEATAEAPVELSALLTGVGGLGATGLATLTPADAGTRVEVSVSGLPEGGHANHVHHGSCEALGEVHVPLTDLAADSAGNASASTVWADNGLDHFAAGHYFAAHELSTADGIGPVIVCGDVVAAIPSLSATLAGRGGLEAAGSVRLVPAGAGTSIEVSVSGLPDGGHANHVHHGSCAALGEVHVPLTDLAADSAGNAFASTVWADNGLDHFAAGHYFAAHELSTADGIGPVIVCGDVGLSGATSARGTGSAAAGSVDSGTSDY